MMRSLALALLHAAALCGCIADLPDPAPKRDDTCDPPPSRGDAVCPALVGDPASPASRCLTDDESACIAGPPGCGCAAGECPGACYPRSCPAQVTAAFGDEATCLTGAVVPECLCGCASCAIACDDVGPVIRSFDSTTSGDDNIAPIVMLISDQVPSAGRLGLFARSRGTSTSLALVYRDGGATIVPYNLGSSDSFSDQLFIDPLFTWTAPEEAPQVAAIFQQTSNTATTLELDCLVPFVLPP